jgi:hypothetical protein
MQLLTPAYDCSPSGNGTSCVFCYCDIDDIPDTFDPAGLHLVDGRLAIWIGAIPAGDMAVGFEAASFPGRRDDLFWTNDSRDSSCVASAPRVARNRSPTHDGAIHANAATTCFLRGDLAHRRQALYYAAESAGGKEAPVRRKKQRA